MLIGRFRMPVDDQMGRTVVLSIIIPTLNAGRTLPATLQSLIESDDRLPCEIIVVDGGSVDDTAMVADRGGAIFIEAGRGRGPQLAAGAEAAAGDWLLFLHADTVLAQGWQKAVATFMADPTNARRAAYFRFRLNDPARAARILEIGVSLRNRFFGMPYGDQGLLVSSTFYGEIGGYRALPLMEDVEIIGRIGRRSLTRLPIPAVTAAARYHRDGYLLRPIRNLFCLSLYSLGVPPRYIDNIYR